MYPSHVHITLYMHVCPCIRFRHPAPPLSRYYENQASRNNLPCWELSIIRCYPVRPRSHTLPGTYRGIPIIYMHGILCVAAERVSSRTHLAWGRAWPLAGSCLLARFGLWGVILWPGCAPFAWLLLLINKHINA